MADRAIVPFDYFDRLLQPREVDPIEATVRSIHDQRLKRDLLQSASPDAVARTTRVAREEGVAPGLIEGREDEVEAMQRARSMSALAQRYPAIGRFANENPRGIATAQDDAESLGLLGGAWDFLKNLPGRVGGTGGWQLGGKVSDAYGAIQELNDLAMTPLWAAMGAVSEASGIGVLDPERALEARARERAQSSAAFRGAAERAREANRGANWVTEGLLQGTESIPLTGLALATGNAGAAASVMGGLVAGGEYARGRAAGLDPATALRYGVTQGSIEAVTEKIPAGTLVDLIARKTPWGKAFVRELGQEMTGEQVATVLQDLTDWAYLPENRGKTFTDYIAERPEAALSTALAVAGGTTTTTVGIGAAQRATDATARVSERFGQARRARAERQFIDRAERAAEGSKLRQRDPEAFRALLRQQAEEAGAENLFISGDAIREYQQSDSYDERSDPFADYDTDEAFAAGGDIVIPIADALTDLVGTPAWQAIKDDIRLAPGGMSAREAATFEESMDDLMAELSGQQAEQDRAEAGQRTVREKIVDRVAEMFGVSFTSPTARTIAELFAQRLQTRAARLGQEVSERDLDGFQVRQVMPEGVAEAVKADALDLVINAMRTGKPVESGVGPSLLEFIAQRGGVNDTGGDLAAMGVPARLLRDFDPRQGSLGGLTGAGDYGIDTTLRAAIEAGFFPDLSQVENEAGASTLDTQRLLDAIAEEVAGRPVYAATREDPMRAAADDLRAMMEEQGLNPDAMSDAEVRAAVEGMASGETEGRAFEQPAFHGSPHIFDRFSLDHIGTGEGAQVYGYGLYFAGKKEVAEFYRKNLSGGEKIRIKVTYQGKTSDDWLLEAFTDEGVNGPAADVAQAVIALEEELERNRHRDYQHQPGETFELFQRQLDEAYARIVARPHTKPEIADVLHKMAGNTTAAGTREISGRLYEVEIPEDDEYLLWDRPLSEQPDKVREGFDGALARIGTDTKEIAEIIFEDGDIGKLTGQRIYQKMIELIPYERSKLEAAGFGGDAWGRTDMIASRLLHDAGIAGIKYLDGSSRGAGDGSFNYVVFDDSRVAIRAYEQEARGRIIFDSNQRIIELFQSRNLSTPLHELSHMWLEELAFDASQPEAPEQLKADWETVKRYFAANGHKVEGQIPTEAHELWARSGERYFMEGKAPTSALARMFEQFRAWLVNIYKTVDRLRAPITPEIREVFDRLLATDEEIAAAQERQALGQLFKDAAEVGMTEAEFQAYQRQVDDARAGAHASLLDKTMRTIRRREETRYRDARKAIREEETERIDGSPVFRAIASMKDQRVSKEWIVDELGADALDLLPVRVPPLYVAGGVHPDVIAELSGYSSGKDMIEALIGAERAHRQAKEGGDTRSMRERAIETATDAEFARRFGDPLNDGSIEREALAAVHSDMQGEVIASELRVLSRKTGQRPTPYRIAREWARGKVRSGVVAQEASPSAIQRYARNAAKAGREAEKAMLAQGVGEAFRQKQFQMLNNALLAEAKEALDEVESAVKRMDKIARAKTRKSVDQDYLEQAHALLEAVDLKERSQKYEAMKGRWAAFAAAREAEGFDIVVPPEFEATINKTHWSRLSVENLLALDEAVKQVMHLGRVAQALIDGDRAQEWEAIYQEAEASADDIGRKPPKGSFTEPSWWDSIKSRAATMDAALLKMEQVFDWLDGGSSNGVFNRVVFRPIAAAQAREQDMTRDYFARIHAALEALPKGVVRRWGDKVTLGLIDPATGLPAVFERKKLVAMALNWGNAGNRQRLADGYGWSPAGVEAALMENLSEAEWQFVQQAWDIIDTLWPEIEKMERAINGVAPEKVEAVEVVTPFGTLRGGYYPAIYDSTLDYTAEEQAGRKTDLFEATYIRASTRASATKARTEKVSRPILLDVGVINRHLGEVIHDVTHREPVMRAHKFLTNRRVMKAVDETLGPEVRKQFRPWLQHVANSWAQDRAGNEGLGRFFSKARANATVVGMGWRFTTMLTQIAGYSNSFEKVGAKWVSAAIAQTAAHPIDSFNFVMERSGEMRGRMDTLDRDIRAEMTRMSSTIGAAVDRLADAKRFAFHGIGYMDRVVTIPTWLGAYNKALAEGLTEEEAAYAGDKAIRLSQGAAGPKDLAAVATGQGRFGEAFKWLTMFYSYLSTVYSRQRNLGRDVSRAGASDLPGLIARAWWLIVVPPLLAEILSGRGPDDDEDPAWWAFKRMISQSVGAIPGVRDVAEPVFAGLTGDFSFGYRLSPMQAAGESVVKVAKDAGRIARGEETKRATRDAMEMAGYFTGLVPGQLAASTQFLVDVGYGEADPETLSDWYTGLTKGRMPEDAN